MQEIREISAFNEIENNKALIGENVEMKNSVIRIKGENNILVIEAGVRLYDSQIKFNASNSVVFISSNKHIVKLNIDIYNNSVFFIGKDNYLNGVLNVTLSEQKNVFIGDNNLFAFGIWIRTADPHLVYSTETKKRINPSKSVFLGDHVWVGQNVFVLKGTKMHSGSILGAGAVCAGKELGSNCSFAGNPAKLIGDGVFWDSACVHTWCDDMTAEKESFESDKYIFNYSESSYIPFDKIDWELSSRKTSDEKLENLKALTDIKKKNRFSYFPAKPVKKGLFGRK
ncbi:MAG: hypothetical protein IJT65_00735 [Eubacterium sp.]|nr:hypothetical protein [Eubacterium sp.]